MSRPALNSPEFNMREIAKQMILLEDHLANDEKFCSDCIRKHILTIEGLSEEGLSLDTGKSMSKDFNKYASLSRSWMISHTDKKNRFGLLQNIRKERKPLMNKVYDPRANKFKSKIRSIDSTKSSKSSNIKSVKSKSNKKK
jgi:hypothetical protein